MVTYKEWWLTPTGRLTASPQIAGSQPHTRCTKQSSSQQLQLGLFVCITRWQTRLSIATMSGGGGVAWVGGGGGVLILLCSEATPLAVQI